MIQFADVSLAPLTLAIFADCALRVSDLSTGMARWEMDNDGPVGYVTAHASTIWPAWTLIATWTVPYR